MWYRVCRIVLVNRTLVSCVKVLEASCVGDVDGCRYVGVGLSLGKVTSARRSFRRNFTLILVGRVLSIFRYLAYCFFDYIIKPFAHS